MELFADHNYLRECENKANYRPVLFSPTTTAGGFTLANFVSGTDRIIARSGNCLFVFSPSNIDQITATSLVGSLNVTCQEAKVSSKIKKFILG
jgi:hypothetical protein